MASLIRQIFTKFQIFNKINITNINKTAVSYPILSKSLTKFYSNAPTPYEIIDSDQEKKLSKDIIDKVNRQVANSEHGRLFAVVHIAGKQRKITEGDVVIVEGYWPPEAGDKISLDKILLIGAADFTLIGRPMLQKGIARVEATVIEKSLSHTKTHFRKKRRKQYMRINFMRIPLTMIRINKIEIVGEINNPPRVSGLETRIF